MQESDTRSMSFEGIARWLARDHLVVSAVLAGLVALTWLDLLRRAGVLSPAKLGHEMVMPQASAWSIADAGMMAAMWGVMMAAMMLPSVTPMVLLFSSVNRRREARRSPFAQTWVFLLGYLLIWAGFSLLATCAQGTLHALLLLSSESSLASPLLGGLVLLVAGMYQFTPLKQTCLSHCQSPLDFLMFHWREGAKGALFMGLHHGLFCLGCCWTLMLLLFVGGVMNLTWIALIAVFVLLERVATRGLMLSRMAGAILIIWGLGLAWEGLAL